MTTGDLTGDEARHQLYDIMRRDAEFSIKAAQALELGRAYLGVDNGHLTRIDPAAGYWNAIESTDAPDGEIPTGLTLSLDSTYCRRTIEQDVPVALHDAPNQGWADDPAFETHRLHCYHGVPVIALDQLYGTVCFISENPREEPFTTEESLFAELIGHLLGQAIERNLLESQLSERDEMIDVLSRVLRHNLRNDLNTIQGWTGLVQDQIPDNAESHAETIDETITDLLALANRTRKLSRLVQEPFDRQQIDVVALVRDLAHTIEREYPDADVSVEGASKAELQASPQLERAFRELLDNAAKHAGDQPTVTVAISMTDEAILTRVSDNGPGLPNQERAVLQEGSETALEHGSGLGLWVAYWIVQRHDGQIETTVSSTGSTVEIALPFGPVRISSEDELTQSERK